MKGWMIALTVVGVLLAGGVGLFLALPRDPPSWIACTAKTGDPLQRISGCTAFIASGPTNQKLEVALRDRGGDYLSGGEDKLAMADLNRALGITPGDEVALRYRAGAFYDLSDYDHAFQDANRAVQLDPTDGKAFDDRGLVYAARGQYDLAIGDFGQAIAADETNARAFTNRALALLAKGEFNAAVPDFNNAVRIDPKLDYAYSGRGLAHAEAHDFANAAADFAQALSLSPDDARPAVGGLSLASGRPDRVFTDLQRAIAATPDEPWGYIQRADVYLNRGDFKLAVADFDQAAKLKPNDAQIANGACWARAVANTDLNAALAFCNQAIALKPTFAEALDSRGFVYFRMGRWDDASAAYSAALAQDSTLASSLYGRALAKQHLGDSDGAAADFAAAKAADPTIVNDYAAWGVTAQ
jgi:tetratricopeptide (TPR) repeat protein